MSDHDHHAHHDHHDHSAHQHHNDDSLVNNVTSLINNVTASIINTTIAAVTQAPAHVHDHSGHDHHDHSNHALHNKIEDHSAHAGHEMRMWFHGGCKEVILFDFWRIETFFGLFISCIIIFIMGTLYEGLKWFRVYIQTNTNNAPVKDVTVSLRFSNNEQNLEQALIKSPETPAGDNTHDVVYAPTTVQENNRGAGSPKGIRTFITDALRQNEKNIVRHRVFQAGLYCVQLTLAYWLMLIAMTYNTWLTAAVVLGAGFGHWLFAALKCVTPSTAQREAVSGDACH